MHKTENIDSFIDLINYKFNLSEDLKNFLIDFINKSNCKKIYFSNFNIPAMGIALHDGVLINNIALNMDLEILLFLILHEIAHQYQFKKYGENYMYNCYIGEMSLDDASIFMKKIEEVADEFASRKIREFQKKNLVKKTYTPIQMYKTIPIIKIRSMIENYKRQMKIKNVNSPEKISEFFYDIVKN